MGDRCSNQRFQRQDEKSKLVTVTKVFCCDTSSQVVDLDSVQLKILMLELFH
jgi:hypothetical protein